ncbi:MAG: thymidine kinase [Nanoarchaeota archaeon]|nr:thymidine kinase [Nanoarchaeota archaeon]
MSNFIEPGTFYLFYGPMKSGKSAALIDHMDFLRFTKNIEYCFFKPETDTREQEIYSRKGNRVYTPTSIPSQKPELILEHLKNKQIIAIDEIQFFGKGIAEVVEEIRKRNIQIIASGLDTDFRGEIFGEMGKLFTLATHPRVLTAVCEYHSCNNKASRTQRLINGQPAPYDAPTVSIEGSEQKETYEARCLEHHIVPGKPQYF